VKLSRSPAAVRKAAPLVGEDNDAVLGELGYDAAAIAGFRDQGVI
jgi:formyl-CoA transferase